MAREGLAKLVVDADFYLERLKGHLKQ